MTTPSFLILVAGPYPSGTSDDPPLIAANLRAMNEASLHLFRASHIPVPGEALSLPLAKVAGSRQRGDTPFNEILHPFGRALAARCDLSLRIDSPSQGADEMVAIAQDHHWLVFSRREDVPGLENTLPQS